MQALRDRLLWVLVLGAAALASLLVPVADPFPFSYQVGQQWRYKDLYAPYSFDVLRPDAAENQPAIPRRAYYKQQLEIAQQQKRHFAQMLQEQVRISKNDVQYDDLRANVNAYQAYGTRFLEGIYSRGIMAERSDTSKEIVVIMGNFYRITRADSLLSLDRAARFLSDSLPFGPLREPELILPMMQKCLVPNVFYSDSLTQASNTSAQKTGESIAKGSRIVLQGEQITLKIAGYLYSLSVSSQRPVAWKVRFAYFGFSVVVLFVFFLWLHLEMPECWSRPGDFWKMGIPVFGVLFVLRILHWAGSWLAFLLPLYLMPHLLQQRFSRTVSLLLWFLTVLLAGLCKDWGFAWYCLQLTGAAVAWVLNPYIRNWADRSLAVGAVVLGQMLVWLALFFAELLGPGISGTDTLVFLFLGGLLSLTQSLITRFWGIRNTV